MGLAALDISCVDMIREQFPISGPRVMPLCMTAIYVPGTRATGQLSASRRWNWTNTDSTGIFFPVDSFLSPEGTALFLPINPQQTLNSEI